MGYHYQLITILLLDGTPQQTYLLLKLQVSDSVKIIEQLGWDRTRFIQPYTNTLLITID